MPLGATLRKTRLLGLGMMSGEGEGAEEGGPDGKDWRDFRARLVSQEKGVESKDGAEDWAYAGALVEQGTVLMGAEGELGFGLRQQYFHKVVMLVVSQEKSFTKALIVNRPTSRTTPRGWRIWFGGDVSGINAPPRLQEWTVLHRLTSREAHEMSYGVMDGIYRTSLALAEAMVASGQAKPEDFWVLCGYAGWGPGQLQMEIEDRQSWHVAATSTKVVNELMDAASTADTLEAGVPVWEELMGRIGLRSEADRSRGAFADDMCREWARQNLGALPENAGEDMVAELMQAALRRQDGGAGTPAGTLLAASVPTPFALSQQFFHKSIILVLEDDSQATAGAILNRPTGKTASFMSPSDAQDRRDGLDPTSADFDQRRVIFGGEYNAGNQVLWLHNNAKLKAQNIGQPVGSSPIWKVDEQEALAAMTEGQARHSDFLLIRGFCIWPKGMASVQLQAGATFDKSSQGEGGLQSEIDAGVFHKVESLDDQAWEALLTLGEGPRDEDETANTGVAAWEAVQPRIPAAEGGEETEGWRERSPEGLADQALWEFVRIFLDDRGFDSQRGKWPRGPLK